jgi:hypothetical protein
MVLRARARGRVGRRRHLLQYAAGGVTWAVLPSVALNTEVRYDHSTTADEAATLLGVRQDESLSGVALNTGLQFRF